MITSECPHKKDSFPYTIVTNGNGGKTRRGNQHVNFVEDDNKGLVNYNVSFGSTSMQAAWVHWTAREFETAGISTAGLGFNESDPADRKTAQINVPEANIWTTAVYGETTRLPKKKEPRDKSFFDLYEKNDDRKARHKALREAGLTPPFPRADKFLENKHMGEVRTGVTTEGSF